MTENACLRSVFSPYFSTVFISRAALGLMAGFPGFPSHGSSDGVVNLWQCRGEVGGGGGGGGGGREEYKFFFSHRDPLPKVCGIKFDAMPFISKSPIAGPELFRTDSNEDSSNAINNKF